MLNKITINFTLSLQETANTEQDDSFYFIAHERKAKILVNKWCKNITKNGSKKYMLQMKILTRNLQ